jgi:phosphoribosyl 1,2-cyclic phosphodiesterase
LRVRFWGVRGTIPVPGPHTIRYGGNTPCIDILTADQQHIIIDAGTGVRRLGNLLRKTHKEGLEATLLLSHTHWDHIQGLPFFDPLLVRRNSFKLFGLQRDNLSLEEIIARQFLEPYLPFAFRSLAASLQILEKRPGESIHIGPKTVVSTAAMKHPGGCLGFRIDDGETVLVYCSDTAHYGEKLLASVVELARGADLLIHDAHFQDTATATAFEDWGHSSWQQAAHVARESDVNMLALFHFAPELSDDDIDQIANSARKEFARTIAAREGLILDIPVA